MTINADTLTLYRSMTTDELKRLGRAFQADESAVDTDEARRFVRERLALIARILDEREQD